MLLYFLSCTEEPATPSSNRERSIPEVSSATTEKQNRHADHHGCTNGQCWVEMTATSHIHLNICNVASETKEPNVHFILIQFTFF